MPASRDRIAAIAATMLGRVEEVLDTLEAPHKARAAALCALICPARACKRAQACRHTPCTAIAQVCDGAPRRGRRTRPSPSQAACDAR
jgi:hypothetical protein